MARIKAILAFVTCLWLPPFLAGFVWAAVVFFGGGLLCAYLIGIRPSGVLVFSRGGLWTRTPPYDVPLYVEVGKYKGLLYFEQLESLGVESGNDGWYKLPGVIDDTRPDWLGDTEFLAIPDDDFGGRLANIYLLGTSVLNVAADTKIAEFRYMYYHGQQYRVVQEYRDGSVRLINVWLIPDSMPALMGAVLYTGLYTCVSVLPVCVAGACGYKLSRRVRQSAKEQNDVGHDGWLYEPS